MIAQADIKNLFRDVAAEIKFREPMSAHTSLRIGGEADVFIKPRDAASLKAALDITRQSGVPVFPLGGGTNLLVRDGGIEGAVVHLGAFRSIEVIREGSEGAVIRAASGVCLKALVDFAIERGLSGMEGLYGIPGLLGGAMAGNAGSFGCEIKDTLISATVMSADGEIKTVTKDGLGFGYRKAIFPAGAIILYADFAFGRGNKDELLEKARRFLDEKKKSQPLGSKSAGCVFKNPSSGAAGKLIDEAGLKGLRIGDIEVSRKHANFFINGGGGTSDDFLRLMDKVASEVRTRFGVMLEPEIKIIGREQ